MKEWAIHLGIKLYTMICRHLYGIDQKKILFTSFEGNTYSDNPRSICEEFFSRGLEKKYSLVWSSKHPERDREKFPAYVRLFDCSSKLTYYKELATSAVVIDNFNFPHISKSKKQYFIQTWHGDRAFKKVLYDSSFAGKLKLSEAVPGFCNLAIAGSDYGERQYRSAFHYQGEILKVGTPRDDRLVHATEASRKELQECIGIDSKYRYLLYAPTLRRKNQKEASKQSIQGIDILRTLSVLEQKYGGEWLCLLRSHPDIQGLTGQGLDDPKIINVSSYPDMADLLIVADALITDYSSSAGDFALLMRPLFLFQDDVDEYMKKDRTFYFSMEESPYYIAKSQDELENIIKCVSLEKAKKNCEDILKFYGTNESGKAASAVVDRILSFLEA